MPTVIQDVVIGEVLAFSMSTVWVISQKTWDSHAAQTYHFVPYNSHANKRFSIVCAGVVMANEPNVISYFGATLPYLDDLEFMYTLTYLTTNGPAQSVTWTRDGAAAVGEFSQRVTDQSTSTYSSVLRVTGRTTGNFTCSVTNDRTAVPVTASLTVNREWEIHDSFPSFSHGTFSLES